MVLIKNLVKLTTLGLSVLTSLTCWSDEIKIYTWEDYISPAIIDQFTKETGHTVSQIYFENEQLRDEVIMSDRVLAYDLIIIDSSSLNSMNEKGLMRTFSPDELPNIRHISSSARQACSNAGIPYTWGTMGIAYRTSRFDTPVDSWMAILQPQPKHHQKIAIPLDDIDTIAPALFVLGYDPFTSNKTELIQAFELLNQLKPYVKVFRNAQSYANDYRTDSDLDIAIAFSGETESIKTATQQNDWQYIIPKEGSMIWYECFASPKGVPMKPATLQFLNFINRPKISALNAEAIWFATTNDDALRYASDTYLSDTEIFPDKKALQRSVPYQPIDLNGLKFRTRMISVLDTQK